MKIFEVNTEIHIGDKFEEVISKIKAKKAFIVTDSIMYKIGLTKKFENILKEKNIDYRIFNEVEVDPSFEVVNKALDKVIDFLPDVIVAIGGGSSLDTAKSIKYFIKKSNLSIPLIALPTTSGTGSEVTSYSVVTKGEHKIALADEKMLPDVALLNTVFLNGLPAKVVADTGMDVLTHSIEAYVSTNANPFSSSFAMKSIKLIFENLVAHYNDRKIQGPKENVQFASCLAGIAFDNSSLGINHSIAHTVGAKFHIAHGRANAIIMPYVIEVNTEANRKYFEISRELGLPSDTIEEGKYSLLSFVRILKEKLAVEKSLKDYGVDFEAFKREIPSMLEDIKKDICTQYNPNKLTDEEYVRLLLKIYFGE